MEGERKSYGEEGNTLTKRIGGLWVRLTSCELLMEAYKNARKGKTHRPDVQKVDENPM